MPLISEAERKDDSINTPASEISSFLKFKRSLYTTLNPKRASEN